MIDDLDMWKLSDELSVVHSALLIVWCDPSQIGEHVEDWPPENQPKNFHAVFSALKNAIKGGRLTANLQYLIPVTEYSIGETPLPMYVSLKQNDKTPTLEKNPDWNKTTVEVDNLQKWLSSRGFNSGFFFPDSNQGFPGYLNPTHESYAPKLAAAINAWTAVASDKELTNGKTVKQAIEIWLRQNAGQYGFTDEDGNPTKSAVEDISKVANWDTKGGAPKTPTG